MHLIVVGSGIVGSACALAATALGAEVTIVESDRPGRATSAGAGIICPWSSRVEDPDWYTFSCAAARAYPALIDSLADVGETAVGYRQVGAMVLTDSTEQQTRIAQQLAARHDASPEMGETVAVDPDQAGDLFPPLRPGYHAVHISGAARVDGRLI